MKYRIRIASQFLVLNETLQTILPCDSCEAIVHNGIAQVAHPHGSFALPYDRFYKHWEVGNIVLEQTLS